LYNFSNFDESVIIDVRALFDAGPKEFKMPEQFSNIWLSSPENASVASVEPVHLKWYGDADEYIVLLSQDADFSNPVIYSNCGNSSNHLLLLALPFMLVGSPLLYRIRGDRRILLLVALLAFTICGCINPLYSPYSPSEYEHSIKISDLEPNHLYFWKIQLLQQNGIVDESQIDMFWTASEDT